MRFFYPVQTGFFFLGENPPEVGAHVPWLDLFAGTAGTPVNIAYQIEWPEGVPALRFGETLVKSKFGLPDISQQTSVEIIYQQSLETQRLESVKLIDPTREVAVELDQLPDDMETVNQGGLTLFSDLPPHLRERVLWDSINRSLKYRGEFISHTCQRGGAFRIPADQCPYRSRQGCPS